MNKFTLALIGLLTPYCCMAQATTEKKGIRLYEHHSSEINDGMPFGMSANGSMSGYDFVNHEYYSSFNPATFGSWGAAEAANIDMVEDQGPFGGGSATIPFGFTSGVSTIWGGDITGNDVTVYAEAPAGFDYDAATDVSYIKAAFPEITVKGITAVEANKVYLARIRSTEMYVAIKVTGVRNADPSTIPGISVENVYFDFDYKYGTYSPSGVSTLIGAQNAFNIVPNPSRGSFEITDLPEDLDPSKAGLTVMDMTGRIIHTQSLSSGRVSASLQAGNYFLFLSDGRKSYGSRLVITN